MNKKSIALNYLFVTLFVPVILISCNGSSEEKEDLPKENNTEVEENIESDPLIVPIDLERLKLKGPVLSIRRVFYTVDAKTSEKNYATESNTFRFDRDGWLTEKIDSTTDGFYKETFEKELPKGYMKIIRENIEFDIENDFSEYFYNSNGKIDSAFYHMEDGRDHYEIIEYDERLREKKITAVYPGNINKVIKNTPTYSINYVFTYDGQKKITDIENDGNNTKYQTIEEYDENGDMISFKRIEGEYVDVYNYKYKYEMDSVGNWILKTLFIDDIPTTIIERKIEYYN